MGLSSAITFRRPLRGTVLLAGLSLLLLLAVPAAAMAGSRRLGTKPVLPAGAQASGPLAQATPLTVTVTLQPQDPVALATYAQQVSAPGSSVYHHYLSVAEFAARFGPTAAEIAAARDSLRAQGLVPGAMAPDDLSFPVTASAGRLSGAFSTSFERYHLRSGRTAYANTSAPQVSGTGASVIQGIIGLSNLAVRRPTPLARLRSGAARGGRALPHASAGSAVTPCGSASAQGVFTANQIASAYGLNALYGAGDPGAGETIALYELEPYSSSDVNAYQSCYGTSTSITNVKVGGGASCGTGVNRDPSCGLEDVLDIEDVVGLAPKAAIRVYEGPNTDAGAYDTYRQIITDDAAQVVSTSWGVCEAQEGSSAAAAENTLFEEAAAQGQSVFAAAGDNGTTDCMDSSGNPLAQRAVDDPASQPYVTGVGGTSLRVTGSALDETVWNDGSGGGAGGGGVSTLWSQPAYQSGFAQSQSSITCGSSGHACREVPDVSADADPNTGYAVYWNGSWGPVGGTSAAAPTWASLTALADASSACTSSIGFANPPLYAAARTGYAANFSDVKAGNNSYDGVSGYPAGTGYDMASGLGSPKGATLAAALCGSVGDSVRLTSSPRSQSSTAGLPISPVTIAGASAHVASPLTYFATSLPRGLTINRLTGRVTGTPTRPGTYVVTLSAVDRDGMIASDRLIWTIRAPSVTLRALTRRTAHVKRSERIALHATDSVHAALIFTASNLPAGLRIDHRTGVISGKPSRRMIRKVTVRAHDAYGGSARRRFTIAVR